MASQQHESFDVLIDGAPPYGFRLVQKLMDNSLVVSKLRQQGKASEAGLMEGDVLQAVNSRSCEGFNCTQALNLIDSSSLPLVLTVKRKAGSKPPPQRQPIPVRNPGFIANKTSPKPSPSPQPRQRVKEPSPVLHHPRVNQPAMIILSPQSPKVPPQQVSVISQIKLTPSSQFEPTKVFVGSTRRSLTDSDEQVIVNFAEQTSKKIEPEEDKKFSDSTFFGHNDKKYPTIEEQVQLARRVAQSVLAPININSKGHKMFLKAKERAAKYTTGAEDLEEEMDSAVQGKLQDMPKKIAYVPKLPTETTNERINAMSLQEIELVKLQERKNPHLGVAPQVCFNLANDLKNMRGKGGRLFAKRQAKAKSWTIGGDEDENIEEYGDSAKQKKVMDSLNFKHNMQAKNGEPSEPSYGYGRKSNTPRHQFSEAHQDAANRLETVIMATKSMYSPWSAAEKFGNVDRAFDHLKPVSPLAYSQQWDSQSYHQPSSQEVTFKPHSAGSPLIQAYNPVQIDTCMAFSDV